MSGTPANVPGKRERWSLGPAEAVTSLLLIGGTLVVVILAVFGASVASGAARRDDAAADERRLRRTADAVADLRQRLATAGNRALIVPDGPTPAGPGRAAGGAVDIASLAALPDEVPALAAELRQLRASFEELANVVADCVAWRDRLAATSATSADHVRAFRQALGEIRLACRGTEGRARLDRTLRLRAIRRADEPEAAALALDLARSGLVDGSSAALQGDLTDVALLCEHLVDADSREQVQDLVDNQIRPVLARLVLVAGQMPGGRDAPLSADSAARLQRLLVGDGSQSIVADVLTRLNLREQREHLTDLMAAAAAAGAARVSAVSASAAERIWATSEAVERGHQVAWAWLAAIGLLGLGAFLGIGRYLQRLTRRQVERIEASDRRVRTIVECASVTLWEFDPRADAFTYVSPQCRELGHPPGRWLEPGFWRAQVHPDDVGKPAALRAAGPCVGPAERRRAQYRVTRGDGSAAWLEEVAAVEQDGGRRLCRGVLIDITDRKQLESHLAEAQRLESIGQLAAGIAHEINTPTQYVSDNVRFLQAQLANLFGVVDRYAALLGSPARPWDDRRREVERALAEADFPFLRAEVPLALAQSLEGLDRVATIVRAMKDFSHPGSAAKEPADLNRSILSTVEVCRNRWKYVAELETDLAADLPPVPCLVAEFNQVVLNLIVNAADAIGEAGRGSPGHIVVSTARRGDWAEVRVQDDGPGIPEKVRRRIFEPFFTTKPVGKGTGQGLMLSRSVIVERHGGTLTFETQEGRGTTFVVRLPLRESPAADPPGAPPAPALAA